MTSDQATSPLPVSSEDVSKVLVVIPAFNEAASVSSVVARVRSAVPQAHILVIDDGSSDGTAEVAGSAGALVAPHPFNLGVGGALRTGYRFAARHGYTAVVQVDADGQHDPLYISALLRSLDQADVVIGARFCGVGEYHVRGPRAWAMRLLSRVMTRLLRVPVSDATSGFRAAGPEAIRVYAQHYPTEYLGDTLETLVIARKRGLRVRQVPVAMQPRTTGRPSRGLVGSAVDLARASVVIALGLVRDWSPVAEGQP
jgi:glycosyltransferase involved in cell wall biosynthesis